jgi:putative FmdB family regulatory protein
MPVYTYRREDGTTFDFKQKFSDEPLTVDPETGQKVVRMVQATGVIFKGSGFYVTDNKGTRSGSTAPQVKSEGETASAETKTEAKSEAKSETKSQPSVAAAAD